MLQDSIQVHLTATQQPFTVLTCELGSGHDADGSACFLELEESRIRTKIQSTGVKLLLWLFSNTCLIELKSAIATSSCVILSLEVFRSHPTVSVPSSPVHISPLYSDLKITLKKLVQATVAVVTTQIIVSLLTS